MSTDDSHTLASLSPTPDCCPTWPRLVEAEAFMWFRFADDPRYLSMPYLQADDDKLRVNFCPSCGAPRWDVIRERSDA